MAEINKRQIVRNAAIAKFARLVEKHLYSTDWTLVAEMCGVLDLLNQPEHERVRRAQRFGDEDYPDAVSYFLKTVFDSDEQVGLLLVHTIAQQETSDGEELSEQARDELEQTLSMFGEQDTDITSILQSLQPPVTEEFIKVTWIPDDFYAKLINEINRVHGAGLPFSLSILIRKLLENLTIDILRKRYGRQQVSLYYNTSRRRFHDFSILLRNLDSRKADFHYVAPNLDSSIMRSINQYRESGNSAAHSIDVNLTVEQVSQDKDNINYLVQYLLRILQRL